ncbi:cytochrome P450 [Schizopora paradoxa]|uniref:Cytochrome P450 n=1 Tax=Schizopora paradoxa TaxID=27342 RepID=A0A0H2R8F6_9AGAM|nr:cytochrome P450 [Schizopora paradoxa]
MSESQILADWIVLLVVIWWLRSIFQRDKHPPGPNGYPIIGNLFDLSAREWWKNTLKWRSEYGDVVFLRSFGQPMIVVNSYDAAIDLFEKRFGTYSDRPTSVMLNELQHWDWMLSGLPYGEQLRKLRTPVLKFFEPSNIQQYEDIQMDEIQKLLRSLLRDPECFRQHFKTSMASSIMRISYGHEIGSFEDPFISLANRASEHIDTALQQGTFIVDVVPWLKYLPKWFPGAGFQVIVERGAKLSRDMRYIPYFFARDKALCGSRSRSFLSEQLDERTKFGGKLTEDDDASMSAMTAICYIAGTSTSVTALMFFILAMTLHQEAQKRAQDEIDRVVGDSRLPELSDRSQLPYCFSLLKEVHRCYPVLPLGVAHASKKADTYNDYFIPAKSVVIPNIWAMLMDPQEYPNPDVFRPERFLPGANEHIPRDPTKVAFGFGRRVCPGKPLAENNLFLAATQILAVFNISKVKKADGTVIEPDVKINSDGIVRQVDSFRCAIEPRSTGAAELETTGFRIERDFPVEEGHSNMKKNVFSI